MSYINYTPDDRLRQVLREQTEPALLVKDDVVILMNLPMAAWLGNQTLMGANLANLLVNPYVDQESPYVDYNDLLAKPGSHTGFFYSYWQLDDQSTEKVLVALQHLADDILMVHIKPCYLQHDLPLELLGSRILATDVCGLGLHDHKGDFFFINGRFRQLLQCEPGCNRNQLIYNDDRLDEQKLYLKLLNGETNEYQLNLRLVKADGNLLWARLHVVSLNTGGNNRYLWIMEDITASIEQFEHLLEAEKRYLLLFENTGTANAVIEDDATVSQVNQAMLSLLGLTTLPIDTKISSYIHPDDLAMVMLYHYQRRKEDSKAPQSYQFRIKTPLGEEREVFARADLVPGTRKTLVCLTDLTQTRQKQAELQQQYMFFNTLLDTLPTPVYYKNRQGTYIGCNRSFESELGIKRNQISGKNEYDFFDPEVADLHLAQDWEILSTGGTRVYESRMRYTDNALHDVVFYKAAYNDLNDRIDGLICVLMDITERKIQEEALKRAYDKLETLSRTDPLTGLLNRRAMNTLMEHEMIRSDRSRREFVIIMADIDHFKLFNDTNGHECGDYVLQELALLLRSFLRKQDQIARWGGEEFLIMLPDTGAEGGKTVAELLRREVVSKIWQWEGRELQISITMGLSLYFTGKSLRETIREADEALYSGKESGRNCVVINA